jgi:hypothetical protein
VIAVVACGYRKAAAPAPAGELYVGPYVRAAMRWARSVTDRVYILSALHGLVPEGRVLAPYDLRLGQPGSITPDRLRAQAIELAVADEPDVAVAGGMDYVRLARAVWPWARAPFSAESGVRGQGYAMAAMAARVGQP